MKRDVREGQGRGGGGGGEGRGGGDRSVEVSQRSSYTSIASKALKAPITHLFPAVPSQGSRPRLRTDPSEFQAFFYLLLLHFTSWSPEKVREDHSDDLPETSTARSCRGELG